jgi:hypothetical protein
MNKSIAIYFGNVILWGLVMIACSLALKGTDSFDKIQNILIGGTFSALIMNGLNLIKPGRSKKES